MTNKRLNDLLRHCNIDPIPEGEVVVGAITADSRKVCAGSLFIALRGVSSDGHRYLASVAAKGAIAALVEKADPALTMPQIVVPDTRELWGKALSWLHGEPERALKFVGITGTNGKTTTSYILEKMLNDAGISTGIIGTIEYRFDTTRIPAPFTSPDPEILYPLLANMRESGVEVVIMEVSSHGLVQERVKGLTFDAALLTNFTQDHLDFHKTMEEYALAKRLLFTNYLREGALVAAWADSDALETIIPETLSPVLYTMGEGAAAWQATEVSVTLEGLSSALHGPEGPYTLNSVLIGEHNILNITGAMILAGAFGVTPGQALAAARDVTVPGRLQRVLGPVPVFVDYAHTPDALDHAQESLKPLVAGRLITVFGCGGDRDAQKRPLMGASVNRHSDIGVVTSDNPRTEDPQSIIDMITPAMTRPALDRDQLGSAPEGHAVFLLREEAINAAVMAAGPADAVLIAGKGHEDYQIVGTVKHHFDDAEKAKEALERYGLT